MNRSEQIKSIAARLTHNKEAREAYREILSAKFEKNEQESTSYKQMQKLFDKADSNIHNLTIDLGELNARMNQNGEVEIY